MRKTHVMPPWMCPECGYVADRATAGSGKKTARPVAGDLSLCLRCAAILTYDGQERLQAAGAAAVEAMKRDAPDVFARMQAARRTILLTMAREASVAAVRH